MTKVRPIPVSSSQAHFEPALVKYHSRAGVARLFFEPTANGVTSHTESASEAAQAASFFVCAQYFLALLLRVPVRLRVIATTATTVVAVITLFAISSQAITHDIVTTAMAAL
jgi:glucan phosphoethanolaminetransferase (alkaline phosphatase superfamily)